jgi:hypothetical protein
VDSSKKETLEERFKRERNQWTDEIKELSVRFRDVDNIPEIQVDLYSKRQIAVEYMNSLYNLIFKLRRKHNAEWNKANNDIINSNDFRYSEKERARIADEKTGDDKYKLDILNSHVQFFQETVKNIDSMIFGIKHRLEAEAFKRGNK